MKNDALIKDLADCGSAETLLSAIMKHHPAMRAPVEVEAIARSAGIAEFRTCAIEAVASALHTDIDKKAGIILSAATLSLQRRRFAIAHQLGHFLLKTQRGDRQCTIRDLSEIRRDTPARKEEMQANRFAAGLLMPKPLFVEFVDGLGKPMVTHLPTIAAAYDVTLEAAAGRYVDLTQAMCAILFIKKGVIRSARSSRSCPPLSVQSGDPAPAAVALVEPMDKIAWVTAEVRDWLEISREMRPPVLTLQVLGKASGVQLVMLFINAATERRADEEAEKLATLRPKFGRSSSAR